MQKIHIQEELGKNDQGKGGDESMNWEDHLEDSEGACSEGAELLLPPSFFCVYWEVGHMHTN